MPSLFELHNVRVTGTGEEVVVLAHGFGSDQSVWKQVIPHLTDDYRLILFDNMGAGTTDPDYFSFDRYSTLHGYAYDLLSILEELQVSSCVYIGHSVMGMVGCLASIERPDLFTKLILMSASPRYLNDVNYFGGFEQDDLDQLFEAMQSNFKAWVSGFAPLAVGDDMDSFAVQEFSRTLFSVRPDIAFGVAKVIFESDFRGILPYVTIPCHILQSNKDLAVPVVVSDYLHQALGAKSIVEILQTEGHLPQLSSPNVVVPALRRHLLLEL
ncbi:hypothetical protein L7F22_053062 [Adiantum nelumboides]|nr:hypothetical protein [Adiantum nelumboides]